MADDAKIASLARRWFAAERERKMRRREMKLGYLLAFKSGAELVDVFSTTSSYPEIVGRTLKGGDPEAVQRAQQARTRYRDSAKHAGALRSALSRLCPSKPEPNAEIEAEYDALCTRETEAADIEAKAGEF